jgi:ketosteroid isomerase-like protein
MTTQDWRQRLFASIDAKDAPAFASFLCEDGTFRYGSGPEITGRAAVEAVVRQVFESFRSCAHRLDRHWDLPDCRICQGVVTYTLHNGKSVPLQFCNVMTMRGELVSRYEIYVDPTPVVAASA